MNTLEFQDLCRSTSYALCLENVENLGSCKPIKVNGIHIALVFDEEFAPNKIYSYINLGQIPSKDRTTAYTRLLSLNLLSGAKTNGVFAIDESTGHAIFVVHLLIPDQFDSEQLSNILLDFASKAHSIRNTILIDDGITASTNEIFISSLA
jgi:hypothetical protein